MTQYDYASWLDEIIDYYESNDVDIDRSFFIRIIERMADSANISFDEMVDILDKSKASEEFREEDHPRDSDGKFTNKGGGSSVVVLEDEIKEHIPKGDIVGSTTIRDPEDYSKKYDIEWGDMEYDIDAISDFRDKNDLWRELELNPDNNGDQEMTVEGEMLEDAMKQWGETDYPNGSVYLTRDGTWVGGKSIYGYDEDHRPQIRRGLRYAGIQIKHTKDSRFNNSSDLTDGLNISGMIRARASPNKELSLDISHSITSSQRRAIQNFMIENNLSEYDLIIDLGNKMKDGNEDTILRSLSYESYSKEEFKEEDHPRDEDGKFTDKDGGLSSSKTITKRRKTTRKTTKRKRTSRNKVKMRSSKHNLRIYKGQKVVISDATNPEYVDVFTNFWNSDPSVKAMRKHIDYIGLLYLKNPKYGGYWINGEKKVVIYDYPSQTLGHFKSTTVHEIVGHTFWHLSRIWNRNAVIEFNEVANSLPPVNQYVKDNEEKWRTWNDEKSNQYLELNKKYDIPQNKYGDYIAEDYIWGDDLKKYNEDLEKIQDYKYIGNPSNDALNRDSSSMTRYANEQHSAITEIMYDTLKDAHERGATEILIGKEDLEKLKEAWRKLHPKFPQKSLGEVWISSTEEFREEDHPRDSDGKFTNKDDGDSGSDDEPKDVKSYKADTLKKVEPKKEIKEKQDKINKTITDKVEEAIKELGIEDKIYDVAMQGSYEKGTDLPDSGSDMDLFVVFKTEVTQEELDNLGLEIGRKVLNKDFIEKQGWIFDYSEEITATSKYVQAFFKDGKQDVEVQIVPTRHLTLEQIKEKKLNGEDIDIGMERTPHQTEYMKEALKGKEGEVRVLKKFMKEAGLYGSNLKEMGFSGYSAEVLIDEFGSFENVIDFFADLKEGDIVDKQGGGKRNKENAFSIIDPIDPNRDLVSAFSTQKIGKTINVAKHFKETGKIPETKYREMDSATITFDSDEVNEDKLTGQVRRLAKSYQEQLGKMGFEINTKEETINGIKVEVPDFSFESEWDNDKQKNTVKINFGTNTKTIPKEYKDKGVDLDRERAVDGYKKANSGLKFVEEDGKLKAIKERQFTDIAYAIKYLMNTEGKIVKSNQNEFIKNNGRISTGKSKFEEI